MMVYVDPTRTRFRLTDKQLAAAAVISRQPDQPRTESEFDDLANAQLIDGGELDPQLEALLDVLTTAPVEITIEVHGAGEAIHLAWVDDDAAVVAIDVGDDVHAYQLVDPVLLPWTLAIAVGVGARPHGDREVITLSQETLEAAQDMVVDGSDPSELLRADVGEVAVGELITLLEQRRATWRASSRLERRESAPVATSMTVLDGGVAGYYTLTVEGGQARITPAKPSEVFERLHHLVPGLMTGELDPHQERLDAALDDPR